MSKIKSRHYYLASKAFPLNKADKSGNSGLYDPNRTLDIDQHNLNCSYFAEYLDSVRTRATPNPSICERISTTKSDLGYGNRKAQREYYADSSSLGRRRSDNVDGDFDSTIQRLPSVVANPNEVKLLNRINFYRNQIKRLEYLKNLKDPSSEKTTKYIKSGTAFGIEIECYVPLAIIGIKSETGLKYRCLNCTSCDEERMCRRDSGDSLELFRAYFKKQFETLNIKNVQIVNDGSLNSNDENDSAMKLYAGIEFRVLSNTTDSLDNLEKLCKLLESIKAKVDASCGLHVHVDMRDASFVKYLQGAERLNNSLFGLRKLVPSSRITDNKYCDVTKFNVPVLNYDDDGDCYISHENQEDGDYESYFRGILDTRYNRGSSARSTVYKKHSTEEIVKMYKNLAEKLKPMQCMSDKYSAINTHSFYNFNTIEVRLHSGTINFEKIRYWIWIIKAVMNSSYFDSANPVFQRIKALKETTIVDFINLLNINADEHKHIRQYIISRAALFAKPSKTEGISFTSNRTLSDLVVNANTDVWSREMALTPPPAVDLTGGNPELAGLMPELTLADITSELSPAVAVPSNGLPPLTGGRLRERNNRRNTTPVINTAAIQTQLDRLSTYLHSSGYFATLNVAAHTIEPEAPMVFEAQEQTVDIETDGFGDTVAGIPYATATPTPVVSNPYANLITFFNREVFDENDTP